MSEEIRIQVSTWICKPCEVGGVDEGEEPDCWNCARPAFVTGRHYRPIEPETHLKKAVYR